MGVLLQGFFFGLSSPPGNSWWDHLARQAHEMATAGFTAIWLPPPLKGASGGFSNGYDPFDDYDLGSKDQQKSIQTHYGSRESLERCAAMMRANGIDIYLDLVENQRDGDDGHFNFLYKDAFGKLPDPENGGGGRFRKGPNDFHPFVPEDPGVFTDQFSFGRDLAPINGGTPKGECGVQLIDAADWLTRALDAQGYRIDNTKGVSTIFVTELLNAKSMRGKFAVGEFADGNIGLLQNWANAVQHRSSSFDFPLHFTLKSMCNNPDGFPMAFLDHAGLVGADPLGAVTFVENHDTDRGGVGGPIVNNKLLAYAYILTAEGYPCVFYRDYSKDPGCFGLKDRIDRLIAIHERVAAGETLQRFKDGGVFAFERLGGTHLLVGLNKDAGTGRTITVQTDFGAGKELQNLTNDAAPRVKTDGRGQVTITIPRNIGGAGYGCYGVPIDIGAPFKPKSFVTTQVYEGARDLDIKPAISLEKNQVCRVFPKAETQVSLKLNADIAHWTNATTVTVTVNDPAGAALGSHVFHHGNQGASFSVQSAKADFHSIVIEAANTPPQNAMPSFSLGITYMTPQTL
jgi:alpha-amylase